MIRGFVFLIAVFWLFLAAGGSVVALVPLGCFYPGPMPGELGYNPTGAHAWMAGMAVLFVWLLIASLHQKSRFAGIAFISLTVLPMLWFGARFADAMRGLH